MISGFQKFTMANGFFAKHRTQQKLEWFEAETISLLKYKFLESAKARKLTDQFKGKVIHKDVSPAKAARELLTKLTAHL